MQWLHAMMIIMEALSRVKSALQEGPDGIGIHHFIAGNANVLLCSRLIMVSDDFGWMDRRVCRNDYFVVRTTWLFCC